MAFIKNKTALAIGLMFIGISSAHATSVFSENFNNYQAGTFNGGQYQTGLAVAYGGNVSGWNKVGGNAVHAVDLDSGAGTNFAPMIWQDNTIRLINPIALSNTSGTTYFVNFDASAAVYQYGPQATTSNDSLLFRVLRNDSSAVASFTYAPGAWTGQMSFSNAQFQYIGDGTGDITVSIGSTLRGGHFAGAIDNLTITSVPEPETYALFLAGLGLVGVIARRRKQNTAI